MAKKKAARTKHGSTWVALFRAVNVGGRNRLPMAELRQELEKLGLANVRSYIQSGNIVFTSSMSKVSLTSEIKTVVQRSFGIELGLLLLEATVLEQILNANPFDVGNEELNKVHCFIWERVPREPDYDGIESMKAASEVVEFVKGGCFVFAPDGVARSKLFSKLEKLMGVPTTARNLKTLRKVVELTREMA